MMDQLCLDMVAKKLATESVSLYVGYSHTQCIGGAKGTAKLACETNDQLSQLCKGDMVTVVYYCIYEQEYHQITGAVVAVDTYWSLLQIGNMAIDFSEIFEIEILANR